MTTLEDLSYGNISPHERYIKRGTRVDKLVKLICKNEEELNAGLTEKQKETFEKFKDCAVCVFTIFDTVVRVYCLQTVYHSSTFRNGSVTRIFQQRQTFMPIWITVQKSLRLRQWRADCNYPKQGDSQVDGAAILQIRVCKKCCRL